MDFSVKLSRQDSHAGNSSKIEGDPLKLIQSLLVKIGGIKTAIQVLLFKR